MSLFGTKLEDLRSALFVKITKVCVLFEKEELSIRIMQIKRYLYGAK